MKVKDNWPEPLHSMGYPRKQVLEICRIEKVHYKKFYSALGVCTCMVDKKLGIILYPCDVRSAIKVAKGGKVKWWD